MNKLLNYLMSGLLLAAMASQKRNRRPIGSSRSHRRRAQHADEKHHSEEEHAGKITLKMKATMPKKPVMKAMKTKSRADF